MRTLTVLFVVSLFAFFLVSFEAVATNSPVANSNVAPIEWTMELPTLGTHDINPQAKSFDGEETEVARRGCRRTPSGRRVCTRR